MKTKQRTWTMAELKYIREHITMSDKQLGDHFGCSAHSVYTARCRYNIPKKGIVDYCFQKGYTPHNKGRKQSEYLSPEAAQRILQNLKKGGNPNPPREVGTTFWLPNKGMMCIRLESNRHYSYAKHVWEQANGVKLKHNTTMVHLDGDKLNCELSNLKPECRGGRRKGKQPVPMKREAPYQFYAPFKQAS